MFWRDRVVELLSWLTASEGGPYISKPERLGKAALHWNRFVE
jgi:hypothetical protein